MGYDRIAGALANLGYEVCDQTVDNVLQRHALPPAPAQAHDNLDGLHSDPGTDFFTAEVLTLRGLVSFYPS